MAPMSEYRRFPLPSPSQPLNPARSSMAAFAAEYALATSVPAAEHTASSLSWGRVMWSAAEAVRAVPHIETPGEKGAKGIYVERTVLDAFLPLNATISLVRAAFRARSLFLCTALSTPEEKGCTPPDATRLPPTRPILLPCRPWPS
jgi:hypothetical protein